MAKFAYNNAKNPSIGYTPFELNFDIYPRVFYKKDVNPRFKTKTADQLATELHTLMSVYKVNLQHAQELQKRFHNKHIKPRNFVPGDKFWLNIK